MDHVSKSSETGHLAFLINFVYFSSQLTSTIISNSRRFNNYIYFLILKNSANYLLSSVGTHTQLKVKMVSDVEIH